MPRKFTIEENLQDLKNKFGIDVKIEDGTDDKIIRGVCETHGVFTNVLAGLKYKRYICSSCGIDARHESNRKNAKSQKISLDELIVDFRKVHGDQYKYSTSDIYRKVDIECLIHGKFSMFTISHKNGYICPTCRKNSMLEIKLAKKEMRDLVTKTVGKSNVIIANTKRRVPKGKILELFREKHGDKFEYVWENFTGKSGSVIVVCPDHGSTTQIIDEHINSIYGCRYCANQSISSAETEWLKSIGIDNTQKIIHHDSGYYKVDGYDIETNTVYEYFGDYWHGHPRLWHDAPNGINDRCKKLFSELFHDTNIRLDTISKLGYNIKYIWESESLIRDYIGELEFETLSLTR